jgi:hypothetical protein
MYLNEIRQTTLGHLNEQVDFINLVDQLSQDLGSDAPKLVSAIRKAGDDPAFPASFHSPKSLEQLDHFLVAKKSG